MFLCWRPCRSRSLIPSLAPSWWWPCLLLRWALLTLSGYVLSVPSAVSLHRYHCSIPSHCRPSCTVSLLTVSVIGARFAFAGGGGGVSPGVWSHRDPWGVAVAPPISPYIGPDWSLPFCRIPLALRSVFSVLLCDIPPVFMAIIWSVSLTPACPLRVIPIRGCSLDTCGASDWLDFLSSSSLFQDSVICADFWSRQSGPDASCDRHSVALALSPSLTVVMTPCYCGMLGGLHVLVGSLPYPSLGLMFEPSCFGRLQCLEAGLTSRPLLALPGLCLMPDL